MQGLTAAPSGFQLARISKFLETASNSDDSAGCVCHGVLVKSSVSSKEQAASPQESGHRTCHSDGPVSQV